MLLAYSIYIIVNPQRERQSYEHITSFSLVCHISHFLVNIKEAFKIMINI